VRERAVLLESRAGGTAYSGTVSNGHATLRRPGMILRTDGSGAFGGGTYDIIGPAGFSLGYLTVPVREGDGIALFLTGLGPTNPTVPAGRTFSGAAPLVSPLSLTLGERVVKPTFVGVVSAGLYQLNLTLPSGLGTGDVPVYATIGRCPADPSTPSRPSHGQAGSAFSKRIDCDLPNCLHGVERFFR